MQFIQIKLESNEVTLLLDHGFFFAKIDITNILVLDNFGGAQTVPLKDYYKAKLYD